MQKFVNAIFNPFREKKAITIIFHCLFILSFSWVIINLIYVYLFLGGAKAYRIESSTIIFVFFALIKFSLSKRDDANTKGPELKKGGYIILALFALLCWSIIYIPYINLPFLSDDYVFLVKFQEINQVFQSGIFFRPAFNLVFYVLLKAFGNFAPVFHILNLLLHLACSCLVYLIAVELLSSNKYAYLTSLVFFLSPIQPESVVWISGLQELLWVFFLLLATYFYVRRKEISKSMIILVSFLVILALLSKETAVCYIPLFFSIELIIFRLKRRKNMYSAFSVFIIILFAYIIIRSLILSIPSDYLSPPNLFFTKSFFSQPFKIFPFPWNQAYYGSYPIAKLMISLTMIFLLWYYFLLEKASWRFILAGFIIFVSALPLYKSFYIAKDLQGSRYLYFSTLGWGIILALIFLKILRNKVGYVCLALLITFLSSYFLHNNLKVWKRAGEIIESLPEQLNEETIPDNYYGAYILRNGYTEYTFIKKRN